MRIARRIVVLLSVLAAWEPAHATHWDLVSRLCPLEVIEIPPPETIIPIGCEVIDCCPGCPGPGELEWRIRVDSAITQALTVRFEGLPQGTAGLRLSGNARLEGDSLVVGPGESSIKGLPDVRRGNVPVASVVRVLDRKKLEVAAERDQDKADGAQRMDGDVSITQWIGDHQVNDYHSHVFLVPCGHRPPPPPAQDRIRLQSNTGTDNAVILTDHRKGTCQDDIIYRTTTTASIGNALTNGACNSDVSVFSDDNAMSFQPNVTTWTNAAGDVHTVNLSPILNVPVSIWVARRGATANATNDVANANLLYNLNNAGIQFTATITDVSGNAAAVTAIDGTANDCASAGTISGTTWYTANRLNIYYVNGAFTGVNCGADRNVSYIGTTANIASLPHEIGHAFGLRPSGSGGHTNGLAGFGNDNIMWGGGPATRDQFTVGQAFRLNVDTTSMLNVNGNRTGSTRTCLPSTTSNICPALVLDATPH